MASLIDPTKPVTGNPTTQSVRDNFAIAKSEITALQISGGGVPSVGQGQISSGGLAINGTASPNPIPMFAPLGLQVIGHDNQPAPIELDAFGSFPANLTLRKAAGTCAVPSPTAGGAAIANIGASGYGATGWASGYRASFQFRATEFWTDAAQGTQVILSATPSGSIIPATVATFQQGMQLGAAPTGGDLGPGTLNVATGLYVNGVAISGTGISGVTSGQLAVAGAGNTITSSIAYGTTGANTIVQTSAGGRLAAGIMPAFTGDVTTVSGAVATTLATVNANVGTWNNVTINAKGLATAGSNVAYLTANQAITLSGDVTGSGTTAISTTLPTVNANVGTFQGLTVNAKGLVTAAANQNYLTTVTAVSTYVAKAGDTMTGALVVNRNAVAAPAPAYAGNLVVHGIDAAVASVEMVTYGANPAVPRFLGRHAGGTGAVPAATPAGANLGAYAAGGYGTGWVTATGLMQFMNAEAGAWTGSANGTSCQFYLTPIGSTAPALVATLQAGMQIGSPAGGDLGAGTLNVATMLQANANAGPLSAAANVVPNGSLMRLVGADSQLSMLTIDAFTSVNPSTNPGVNLRRSNGTGAAPSAVQNTNALGNLSYRGFGATAWGANAVRLTAYATENWSDTAQGANLQIYCNSNGSIANPLVATFQSGMQIGAPAGGDLGAGTLNMAGAHQINKNAAVVPAGIASVGAMVTAQAADGIGTLVNLNTFGAAGGSRILCYASGGTAATPVAVTTGGIVAMEARGYDGSAWSGQQAAVQIAQNTSPWTTADHSTKVQFNTTPVGSTVVAAAVVVAAGVVVGAPTGGDKGAGTLNATGVYANNVLLTSDAQLKTDIAPLPECLGLVAAIEPKRFKFKDPGPTPSSDPDIGPTPSGPEGWFDKTRWGFIAQDVEKAMTGHDFGGIEKGADGMRSLSHSDLLAVLWQAVRELAELKGKSVPTRRAR